MMKTLVLKEENGRVIRVTAPSQLGRSPSTYWCVPERKQPESLGELELAIEIDGSTGISRNHCAVFPNGKGYLTEDLGSLNGTYINNQKIIPGQRAQIPDGGVLKLGDYPLICSYEEPSEQRQVLLVGSPGRDLYGLDRLIHEIEVEFQKRNYDAVALYGKTAKKEDVLHWLAEFAGRATADSHTFFHYIGHGDQTGIRLYDHNISPEELTHELGNIRGKKAEIIDCCYAGIFQVENPEALIITATEANEPAWARKNERGEYRPILSQKFLEYLGRQESSFNLKTFERAIRNGLFANTARTKFQKPAIRGKPYTVASRVFKAIS